MTDQQRAFVRTGYRRGLDVPGIAAYAGVSEQETEIYLTWWCDQGCLEDPRG